LSFSLLSLFGGRQFRRIWSRASVNAFIHRFMDDGTRSN